MTIKKYLHSCVALEENGKRLLFDPGAFVFIEGKMQPEDIGPVDVVVITHTHPDHYFPEALQKLHTLKPFTVVTSTEIASVLEKDGLGFTTIAMNGGEEKEVEGFSVHAFDVPHEQIPIPCPHNMGYKVNGVLYHPGDSFAVPESIGNVKALLLPNGGPWATTVKTVAFAEQIKPEIAIPIHDGMHKDFWLERLNAAMSGWMKDRGIECKILAMGEEISI